MHIHGTSSFIAFVDLVYLNKPAKSAFFNYASISAFTVLTTSKKVGNSMQNKLVDITIGTQMAGVVSFQLWDTRNIFGLSFLLVESMHVNFLFTLQL